MFTCKVLNTWEGSELAISMKTKVVRTIRSSTNKLVVDIGVTNECTMLNLKYL
jgi:hypothetical protein